MWSKGYYFLHYLLLYEGVPLEVVIDDNANVVILMQFISLWAIIEIEKDTQNMTDKIHLLKLEWK